MNSTGSVEFRRLLIDLHVSTDLWICIKQSTFRIKVSNPALSRCSKAKSILAGNIGEFKQNS